MSFFFLFSFFRVLAVGSKDMCTKLYSLEKFANFRGMTLGSHSDAIRAIFFEKNSLDLITIARYFLLGLLSNHFGFLQELKRIS